MAAREMPNEGVARVSLGMGDEYQKNCDNATQRRAEITEAGRLASSIGGWLDSQPTVQDEQKDRAEKSQQPSWLTEFKNVVDPTLDWIENSGQAHVEKLEQILRGLYNLTGLANDAHVFAIMKITCVFLNTAGDPFPGQRQYIVRCLESVETKQEQITSLVQQASALLDEILQGEEVDYSKGRQFDNIVRQARVLIESCRRWLDGVEQAISELSRKMGPPKWASRGFRGAGWLFLSCFFFKRYLESSRSSMDLLEFGGGVVVSGWVCLALIPGKASVYFESLAEFEADHRILKTTLEDLRKDLMCAKDYKDGP